MAGSEATSTDDIFSFDEDDVQLPPEVYGPAYAQVIGMARSSWNLQ